MKNFCVSVAACAVFLSFAIPSARARDLPVCGPTVAVGASCLLAAGAVRPTQMAFGEIEVARRASAIAAMDAAALDNYLRKHVMPVVIGPGRAFYATDRHHLAIAVGRANGRESPVIATVVDDWHTLEPAVFWKRMLVAGRAYPFDETGAGPFAFALMPASVFDLRDDPLRSLANGLQNAGGYADNSGVPYADFLWAEFLRPRVSAALIASDFGAAVAAAKVLACSPAAVQLPGASGASCR